MPAGPSPATTPHVPPNDLATTPAPTLGTIVGHPRPGKPRASPPLRDPPGRPGSPPAARRDGRRVSPGPSSAARSPSPAAGSGDGRGGAGSAAAAAPSGSSGGSSAWWCAPGGRRPRATATSATSGARSSSAPCPHLRGRGQRRTLQRPPDRLGQPGRARPRPRPSSSATRQRRRAAQRHHQDRPGRPGDRHGLVALDPPRHLRDPVGHAGQQPAVEPEQDQLGVRRRARRRSSRPSRTPSASPSTTTS